METIRFNGNLAPAYTCDTSGDQSGEYVRAEVAKGLLEACEQALPHLVNEPAADSVRAAIAAARGE